MTLELSLPTHTVPIFKDYVFLHAFLFVLGWTRINVYQIYLLDILTQGRDICFVLNKVLTHRIISWSPHAHAVASNCQQERCNHAHVFSPWILCSMTSRGSCKISLGRSTYPWGAQPLQRWVASTSQQMTIYSDMYWEEGLRRVKETANLQLKRQISEKISLQKQRNTHVGILSMAFTSWNFIFLRRL